VSVYVHKHAHTHIYISPWSSRVINKTPKPLAAVLIHHLLTS